MPASDRRERERVSEREETRALALGCGPGEGRLGRALEAACSLGGISLSSGHDAGVALWTVRERELTGDLTVLVAGPALSLAESVHLARALGGSREPAPVVAIRDHAGRDALALLLGAGCCDCQSSQAEVDALLRGIRLAAEIARRRRAEKLWGAEGGPEDGGAAVLGETRRLAAIGRTHLAYVHDLRNLIHPIRGYADLLGEVPEEPAEQRRIGGWIAALADQMEELLRRSVSAAHGGSATLWVEADREVGRLETLLRAITGPGIGLDLELDGRGATIRIRPGAVDQVVLNLAENAREAMPRGGHLRVRTSTLPGKWRLEVVDSGSGIPAERLRSIFEPGESSHEARAARGFGLWLVQGLVSELEGTVAIESGPDEGTRVVVELPASGADSRVLG